MKSDEFLAPAKSNLVRPSKSLLKGYDDLVSAVDQKQVIVVEVGSLNLRVGYSGENEPRVSMPACFAVSRTANKSDYAQPRAPTLFGHDAIAASNAKEDYELIYPFGKGNASVNDFENLFVYVFEEMMNLDPLRLDLFVVESHSVLAQRMQLCELFFETLRVQSLNFVPSALCSFLYTGATTGVSVEAGEKFTSIVPLFEGFILSHRVQHLPYAGAQATEIIAQSLQTSSFATAHMPEVQKAIKEKLAVVVADYEGLAVEPPLLRSEERCYELPDGEIVELNPQTLFDAGEVLFCPQKVLETTATPLCQAFAEALVHGDEKSQVHLSKNIVVSGGSSLTRGYFSRLKQDLTSSVSEKAGYQIEIYKAADIPHSAWIGGSVLASIATIYGVRIKKSQYEEAENKLSFLSYKTL